MAIDWTGVTLPFSVTDLLSSGAGLIGLVSGFVLLAMAFPLVTKLVGLIKRTFSSSSGK